MSAAQQRVLYISSARVHYTRNSLEFERLPLIDSNSSALKELHQFGHGAVRKRMLHQARLRVRGVLVHMQVMLEKRSERTVGVARFSRLPLSVSHGHSGSAQPCPAL